MDRFPSSSITSSVHWGHICFVRQLESANRKGCMHDGFKFQYHTHINGRMSFGTRRIKYIKAFTQWVQDFYRVSGLPSIVGLYEVTLKHQLDRASARADIRKWMANQTMTLADVAFLELLENEKQWKCCEENVQLCQISHQGKRRIIIIRDSWKWGARYQRLTSGLYK